MEARMSEVKFKKGALSTEEMNYIRQNCFDLSIDEIAEKLKRTVGPVRRFIERENLKARDLTTHEHLLGTLKSRYYYKELLRQLDEDEMLFFEQQWVDYFHQFNEDVIHTEEMQIIEVIRTEILLNRNMKNKKQANEDIKNLRDLIDQERDQPPETQDTQALSVYLTQLGSLMGSQSSYVREYTDLLQKKQQHMKDLKGTREQRKRIADDAKTNFTLWLRETESPEFKRMVGSEIAVQAIAADKVRKKLSEYHRFEDGEYDQPLFNSENIIEDSEE
jgi:hypothetical protein